mmetsp:Transcript_52703/g.104702  ORF Transcript_52703/g.104702 Transcript_52703/m.104702 type:complete len:281 (-) Transcript_52703:635-1477(-)
MATMVLGVPSVVVQLKGAAHQLHPPLQLLTWIGLLLRVEPLLQPRQQQQPEHRHRARLLVYRRPPIPALRPPSARCQAGDHHNRRTSPNAWRRPQQAPPELGEILGSPLHRSYQGDRATSVQATVQPTQGICRLLCHHAATKQLVVQTTGMQPRTGHICKVAPGASLLRCCSKDSCRRRNSKHMAVGYQLMATRSQEAPPLLPLLGRWLLSWPLGTRPHLAQGFWTALYGKRRVVVYKRICSNGAKLRYSCNSSQTSSQTSSGSSSSHSNSSIRHCKRPY